MPQMWMSFLTIRVSGTASLIPFKSRYSGTSSHTDAATVNARMIATMAFSPYLLQDNDAQSLDDKVTSKASSRPHLPLVEGDLDIDIIFDRGFSHRGVSTVRA